MPNELVLVTGASSDIGLAFIRRLLAEQPETRVLAHFFRGSTRTEALIADFGHRVVPVQADFSKPDEIPVWADAILAQHGVPTAIVHLPALRLTYDRFTKLKWERLEQDLTVQVQAAVLFLQRMLPKMAKLPAARVVFVLSSVVHGMPPKFLAPYTIVKYAQLGLMRALAAEYAATPIRINAISPSMVVTQFLGDLAPVAVEMSASANPLGRNAVPEDLIPALLFLISPGAAYLTGADLPITAGSVC